MNSAHENISRSRVERIERVASLREARHDALHCRPTTRTALARLVKNATDDLQQLASSQPSERSCNRPHLLLFDQRLGGWENFRHVPAIRIWWS